jgi:hypothetical protein
MLFSCCFEGWEVVWTGGLDSTDNFGEEREEGKILVRSGGLHL